ncbi:hypothetical protein IMSAGC014_01968 [Bacteroidaceae bacterium]|nr:hypothetical protein IMSAGC014_01968 [Bacteroidaceae bacterium]
MGRKRSPVLARRGSLWHTDVEPQGAHCLRFGRQFPSGVQTVGHKVFPLTQRIAHHVTHEITVDGLGRNHVPAVAQVADAECHLAALGDKHEGLCADTLSAPGIEVEPVGHAGYGVAAVLCVDVSPSQCSLCHSLPGRRRSGMRIGKFRVGHLCHHGHGRESQRKKQIFLFHDTCVG